MTPAVIWLVLGLVLIAAEVLSGEFVLVMLGGAALAAAGVSFFVAGVLPGAVVFAVAAGLLVFAARPALRRRLDHGIEHSTMHAKALVGASAVVVSRVDGHGGRIKLRGELWSARSCDGHEVIEEGATVTVMDIAGATALVVGRD
ncbi:NfeD family protein [Pseudonocardia humida]|uniref:NfeD family protein n=1 Tax=Pseudonocardia humida TaxID=2800819 RepID=A0ABT1AAI5_9PSEU|nr:NfeD family protein [Pseudonocardia humida]MCO1660057.1 NfeD family protein [Pseudonocardia humida]